MCLTCWEKHGSSKIVNAKVKKALLLISDVYDHHAAAGGLHVVIDDWNIEDEMISGSIATIKSKEYMKPEDAWMTKPTPERRRAELKCARHLLKMTIDERNSALWHELTRTTPK